jgi:transposase-like protein
LSQAGFRGGFESRTICPRVRRTSSDATIEEVSKELIERGVRLAIESGRPVAHVARDIGLPSETLRKRVRQAEADGGLRPDLPTSAEREEIAAQA